MTKKSKRLQEYNFPPCPEHGYEAIIFDQERKEAICGLCGLVLSEKVIDMRPEWRAYTLEEKERRNRIGTPTSFSLHDKGLSTTMWGDRDVYGRYLPSSTKIKMQRLKKLHHRLYLSDSKERNLAEAMSELDRLADVLEIPPRMKEEAAIIYRKALKKGLIRGRWIDAIVTASLYLVIRREGFPRTLDEICEVSSVERRKIMRSYKLLQNELDLHVPPPDPLNYLSKIAEKAGVSQETQGIAARILKEVRKEKLKVGTRRPQGLVAAALYVACKKSGEHKTQTDLAEAANVTDVTVRNLYKILIDALSLDID